jgi:erythromycin esterase-like protein
MYSSIEAVLKYLHSIDPEAAARARRRYECFEPYNHDPQKYGYAAGYGLKRGCESQAVAQLVEMQRLVGETSLRSLQTSEDEHFYAEQNARLVRSAEEYYRQMYAGERETWNLRDTYMTETIAALSEHLEQTRGSPTKLVVWAHNSHLGDARETEMGDRGEVNVGQLCRERWGAEVFNIGFTTHTGVVAAATHWGDPVEMKRVNTSLDGSCERAFHEVGVDRFALIFKESPDAARLLASRRMQRAIGVIYRSDTERMSHYFDAAVSRQFDALIHIDTTYPVRPLEIVAEFDPEKAETFPSGL